MFIEPYSHFLISPRPFKRMCIKLIVLRPSSIEMIDQCLAASPGLALEVAQGESMIEQFSLVEPGGMDRGETRPPPGVIVEIALRGLGGMAGVTILNQEHTAQMSMATAESTQSANITSVLDKRRGKGYLLRLNCVTVRLRNRPGGPRA